jgi:hypothetical protein
MSGAIPPFPQYAFMAWCSVKVQGQLYILLDGGEWSTSRPGRFTPGKRNPGIRCIGGWVGPKASLEAVEKRKILSPSRELNPGRPSYSQALY